MKKLLVILLTLTLLSGCAGLSVNWDLSATYRSDVPFGERAK